MAIWGLASLIALSLAALEKDDWRLSAPRKRIFTILIDHKRKISSFFFEGVFSKGIVHIFRVFSSS